MDELPVDVLHWLVALSPILLLLVLLAVRGWKAPQAGPLAMFLVAGTGVIAFRAPLETIATAVGAGVWDAVFILLVIWPALLLYRVTDAAGAFDALREGIERFSKNQLFLVLSFGWVFASFLQGITGFGTPIAVVAPLLVALGVRPVLAVAIPLIGHAWANLFGTLSVAWLATLQVIDLDDERATAFQSALLLLIVNALGGLTIAWLFGRWQAIVHALPFIAVIALLQGGGQLALVLITPELSAFLAATVALLALYPLSRWKRYSEPTSDIERRPAMDERAQRAIASEREPVMSFAWSLFPYAALSVPAMAALAIPPVASALETVEFGVSFAETTTGYGVTSGGDDASPLTPLTHPGTYLALAALATWLVYRWRGFYAAEATRGTRQRIWKSTAEDAIPASLAVVSFLILAKVMDYTGQIEVLALGIAAIAPSLVFAFLSNFIGVLGSFMTSSNTASNVLFAQLQDTIAQREELAVPAIIAAQGAGGAIGNAISPANVVLGTTTAGIVGSEGAVLRRTLPWAGIAAVCVGLVTLLLI